MTTKRTERNWYKDNGGDRWMDELPPLFKFLTERGTGTHARHFTWPLPTKDGPGEWVEIDGQLRVCSNGLHATTAANAPNWKSDRLFIAEPAPGGGVVSDSYEQKIVVRKMRLVREILDWPKFVWGRYGRPRQPIPTPVINEAMRKLRAMVPEADREWVTTDQRQHRKLTRMYNELSLIGAKVHLLKAQYEVNVYSGKKPSLALMQRREAELRTQYRELNKKTVRIRKVQEMFLDSYTLVAAIEIGAKVSKSGGWAGSGYSNYYSPFQTGVRSVMPLIEERYRTPDVEPDYGDIPPEIVDAMKKAGFRAHPRVLEPKKRTEV